MNTTQIKGLRALHADALITPRATIERRAGDAYSVIVDGKTIGVCTTYAGARELIVAHFADVEALAARDAITK
jgi:hypothetical protein